jgi:hypothetical protein
VHGELEIVSKPGASPELPKKDWRFPIFVFQNGNVSEIAKIAMIAKDWQLPTCSRCNGHDVITDFNLWQFRRLWQLLTSTTSSFGTEFAPTRRRPIR